MFRNHVILFCYSFTTGSHIYKHLIKPWKWRTESYLHTSYYNFFIFCFKFYLTFIRRTPSRLLWIIFLLLWWVHLLFVYFVYLLQAYLVISFFYSLQCNDVMFWFGLCSFIQFSSHLSQHHPIARQPVAIGNQLCNGVFLCCYKFESISHGFCISFDLCVLFRITNIVTIYREIKVLWPRD